MSIEEVKDLLVFLKPFAKQQKDTALWLRDWIWKQYPTANELIYDNYNALAFGWSVSDKQGDTFCHVAVGSKAVNFGLYRGAVIPDPEKKFFGSGNQARHIKVFDVKDFPKEYVGKMVKEAYINACLRLGDKEQVHSGLTIVKSISEKKRRPS